MLFGILTPLIKIYNSITMSIPNYAKILLKLDYIKNGAL
ncbi:hypothetical protein BSM4216_1869 [Bacillus smithii]|nr:hypothetical protein BSM4216_1869 [Bacillus smithii]